MLCDAMRCCTHRPCSIRSYLPEHCIYINVSERARAPIEREGEEEGGSCERANHWCRARGLVDLCVQGKVVAVAAAVAAAIDRSSDEKRWQATRG